MVGDINQSKSVPMMSLNVVGNIDQSNFRCLCRSPWVSMGGLCRSPWVSTGLCRFLQVSAGGLPGSPWVVVGKINQSKSVPMMSLNVVGNINQSNFRHLRRSLQVSAGASGLCGSLLVVSAGLRGWWWGKLTNQNLCQ